jgi:formate hydrogenlyase subunit 3/multisubunit Na+/H+ antiporter MnhD subunit
MVASLLHPLNIFIVGLGAGFLIPLFDRLGKSWVTTVFVLALATMTLISGYAVLSLLQGAVPIEILTGGANPPYAINLRMGLAEGIFAFCVNLVTPWCHVHRARKIRRIAALPAARHGHPGHGDDPRSL